MPQRSKASSIKSSIERLKSVVPEVAIYAQLEPPIFIFLTTFMAIRLCWLTSPPLKGWIVCAAIRSRSQTAWTLLREARIGVTAAIVAAFPLTADAQTRDISGKVTMAGTGQPIADVTISIVGQQVGVPARR